MRDQLETEEGILINWNKSQSVPERHTKLPLDDEAPYFISVAASCHHREETHFNSMKFSIHLQTHYRCPCHVIWFIYKEYAANIKSDFNSRYPEPHFPNQDSYLLRISEGWKIRGALNHELQLSDQLLFSSEILEQPTGLINPYNEILLLLKAMSEVLHFDQIGADENQASGFVDIEEVLTTCSCLKTKIQ